jgi:hypothetical protein
VGDANPGHQSALGESGEMKQYLKARAGAQRVIARIHPEPDQIAIPMRAALFKRVKGFIILAQGHEPCS